jgi:HEAT repeat protein
METSVKGFITSGKDRFQVQLGAFRLKLNAEAFFIEVRKHIDNNAIMIKEDGFYKIRITMSPEPENAKQNEQEKSSGQPGSEPSDAVVSNDTIKTYSAISDSTKSAAIISDTAGIAVNNTNEAGNLLIIGSDSPWLRRIQYFGKSIAFVNALIVTITICIATMVILLIVILLNRRRMEKEEKLKNYLLEKYQNLIIDYLFGDAKPDDFRPIASDTYRRQVLIDQMIDVSVNLKGEEAKKLLGLYKHLGLDRDSIARVYDYRWHKKIKGFRELAFMNIKDANPAIYKALNSSNEILRMEAQIALVRLSDDNPFEFLSHLTRPFSLWEQITLHDLMVQHQINPPLFSKWLSSPNDTVVMFALRMIREFKQKEAEAEVKETLSHKSPSVRWLAVQVAGDMGMTSTLEPMKRMYKNQDYNICLEIVRAMGKMPDESMMGFLKLVLDKEDDVQLQIEATKAIENMGEEGVKTLVKLMKSEYKNYNIIVRHVLDHRIY